MDVLGRSIVLILLKITNLLDIVYIRYDMTEEQYFENIFMQVLSFYYTVRLLDEMVSWPRLLLGFLMGVSRYAAGLSLKKSKDISEKEQE